MIDLSQYTVEELVELKDTIANRIYEYEDGYFYICNVRSYGRNWKQTGITNTHTLQDLCSEYNGDDGIVDVYSNNPNIHKLHNYGDLAYVPTEADYKTWKDYTYLKNSIPALEQEHEEWDNRDNVPFRERPHFAPIYTRENLEEMKSRLENYDMSFTAPVRYSQFADEENC
jgi:hypothetical protein